MAGNGESAMEIEEPEPQQKAAAAVDKRKAVGVAAGLPPHKDTPWVEKYRPQSLADVSAHRDIVDTIDRLTTENKLPHLLLYGPPGTGKTSTILAVARKIYGSQYQNMILELNASDDRGIDVVRQQIQDFASTQSFSFSSKSSVKLVLLDEADAMTKDAQFALRRVIEKYTKSTRFALICNHVSKIIPALQSRCTRFRFAPLDAAHITERVQFIIKAEGIDVTESGLAAIVRLSNGDMRKALNILQSTHMASQHVTEAAVYLCTGNPMPKDIEKICFWLLNEAFSASCRYISEIRTKKGLALIDIVREVTMFIFKIKMLSDLRVQLINDLADIDFSLDISEIRTKKGLALIDIVREVTMFIFKIKMLSDLRVQLINDLADIDFSLDISEIRTKKGLALIDIVREVTMFIFKIKMLSDLRVQLINDLADIEYRLSFGCIDKLQLGSLISSFTHARSAMVASAK